MVAMGSTTGRTRRKLAELLQREFPTCGDQPVSWFVDQIYAATGWYRTSRHHSNDCYRWEAFSIFDRSGNTAHAVASYDTMTECVKLGHLVMHSDGEITASACPTATEQKEPGHAD
jgi:hypothetical protein